MDFYIVGSSLEIYMVNFSVVEKSTHTHSSNIATMDF